MAQFDVYVNPSKHSKKTYPYILDIQHSVIEDLTTRIVAPLGELSQFRKAPLSRLTPQVSFEETELLILMPQITSVPAKTLKQPIGTLSHLRYEIIAALDFAISGI